MSVNKKIFNEIGNINTKIRGSSASRIRNYRIWKEFTTYLTNYWKMGYSAHWGIPWNHLLWL